MSETQAFFLLSVLCDRLLPGYYSTTMYGTLLDQKVFESLVEKTMPVLNDHLKKFDVQLSVVSLPWFLSLYINSMPLVFAFRVLDVFFLEGPKVLFQVGLAILRINGEELLDAQDDGAFISILKSYFSRLDESAHPKSENEKLRAVTRFQELMVVAFKEFSAITQSTISDQRAKLKHNVLNDIESFAKRTSIRNLGPDSKKLSMDDLGILYDRFYGVLYERQQRMQMIQDEKARRAKSSRTRAIELFTGESQSVEKGRVGLGPSPTLMDYDGFREFLAGIAKWAITDSPLPPSQRDVDAGKETHTFSGNNVQSRQNLLNPWGAGNPEPADHEFMRRLFQKWDTEKNSGLSLQNVVTGFAHVKGTRDIMNSISYFFELYDDDGDGKVDREGILRISEALLFLSRRGLEGTLSPVPSTNSLNDPDTGAPHDTTYQMTDERFLNSVSAFIRRCFEYADPDHPSNQNHNPSSSNVPSNAVDTTTSNLDSFSIGGSDSDSEEDLLDLTDGSSSTKPNRKIAKLSSAPSATTNNPLAEKRSSSGREASRKFSKAETESANLALDPANPLHITLPTFRMVILADELLEAFFESFFPSSLRLSDKAVSSLSTSSLTTFSSLRGVRGTGAVGAVGAVGAAGAVNASKGLRGVLDGIVTDGMRVAAEVRRRMDEAQREMERNALGGRDDGEDDEDVEAEKGGEEERRSVRDADRDLLEGAEAEGVERMESVGGLAVPEQGKRNRRPSEGASKVVEFEV
jgi:hypothetical protein